MAEVVKFVRVKPPVCALRHPDPDVQDWVVPNPSLPYRADDPLVLAYPWQFQSDDDLTPEQLETPTSVPLVETVPDRPARKRG